jgi:hypothetical protein
MLDCFQALGIKRYTLADNVTDDTCQRIGITTLPLCTERGRLAVDREPVQVKNPVASARMVAEQIVSEQSSESRL